MQGNIGFDAVEEAFHAMSPEAAARFIDIGQMYAERFPRPIQLTLCAPPEELKQLRSLATVGECSPSGMCIISWPDRRIAWSNNVYQKYFVDLEKRSANVGMRIDEALPGFVESGLEAIFEQVATTRKTFQAKNFALQLPNSGMTYWDWSLTVLPLTGGTVLLVQSHQVAAIAASPLVAAA
jgi:hypothetical protein